jgi:dolichol-phosphate mannosyltransferase
MIFVVLPAYNEAEALPRLIGRLIPVLIRLGHRSEIIVVDDGSTDGTGAAAGTSPAETISIRVVRHVTNLGLHRAVDTGLRTALVACSPTDIIVTMDADDTHPPDLIPAMLERIAGGADVVVASRFQPGAEWHGKTWDRILFSHGVSWLFRAAWPLNGVKDYTCGFRAYRADLVRRAYERWAEDFVSEKSFACMPDILFKVSRFRPTIVEVPLDLHYDRKPGVSKMRVARTIRRTLVVLMKRRLGFYH